MDLFQVGLEMLGTIFGVVIMTAPFLRRFRGGSLWLRLSFFIGGLLLVGHFALGLYLLLHKVHGKTSLPLPRFWALDHLEWGFGGLGLGVLACLFLSPECRRLNQPIPRV